MDSPAPLQDDVPNGPLIDAGAALALRLVRELRAVFARERAARFGLALLRFLVRHYLLPAEAALRRAIYLIADTMPEPQLRPARPGPVPLSKDQSPATARRPRAPSFRLTEPPPRERAAGLPPGQRPRISVIGLTPRAPEPVRRPADPVAAEDRLQRRLAAMDAVFADPRRAARRLLRRLQRPQPRPVLAFAAIPGLGAIPLNQRDRDLLAELNTAILAAFYRSSDTS